MTDTTKPRAKEERERDVPSDVDGLGSRPKWVHAPALAATARGERTRQQIISAADELFRTSTKYENIAVADIARASGTSVGTIYRYFESKEDLLHLLLSNAFWRMYKASRGVWRSEEPAEVNIERTTRAYLEAFFEERAFLRVAFRIIATSDTVRKSWWAMRRELRERMRSRLQQDFALGTAAPLNAEVAIRALLGMVNAYAVQAFIDEEYGPAMREEIPEIATVLAQIWYRSVIGVGLPDGVVLDELVPISGRLAEER